MIIYFQSKHHLEDLKSILLEEAMSTPLPKEEVGELDEEEVDVGKTKEKLTTTNKNNENKHEVYDVDQPINTNTK